MDQHKNQGQQKQGQSSQGQQQQSNDGNNPNREQADGSRDERKMPADQGSVPRGDQERGKGSGSGISNRGLDAESEQEDLPDRGSSNSDDSF